MAYFIWKPEHFEFLGYRGAWHKATLDFVENYTPTVIHDFKPI